MRLSANLRLRPLPGSPQSVRQSTAIRTFDKYGIEYYSSEIVPYIKDRWERHVCHGALIN